MHVRHGAPGSDTTKSATARRESIAPSDDHVIVVFGATGDLSRRKLLPGLFHLARAGLLPARYRIIGSARSALTDDEFRRRAKDAVTEFGRAKPTGEAWRAFANSLFFAAAEPTQPQPLLDAVAAAEKAIGGHPRRLFHLAVPPAGFGPTVGMLGGTDLARNANVIIEKPFGTDLASARALNETIHATFDESQVFRIDHFLGRESVDNILALRFANGLFEPIWNREHVSHVQIDVPETIGIEGRAGFFEAVGAGELPGALDDIRAGGRADGLDIRTQVLDPAELRWYVEEALDVRAVHDEEGPADAASAMFDEEEGSAVPGAGAAGARQAGCPAAGT